MQGVVGNSNSKSKGGRPPKPALLSKAGLSINQPTIDVTPLLSPAANNIASRGPGSASGRKDSIPASPSVRSAASLTIGVGGRSPLGRSASSIVLRSRTSPKASPAMSTPPVLAWKHRLELSEVRRIVREFAAVKSEGDVISEADFRKVLCSIFSTPAVDRDLGTAAYRECDAAIGFDVDKFCGWYVRNMFTAVNRLNAAADRVRSDSMVYEASKKFRIPTAQIDKIKRVFDRFDTDGSGEIDYDEFKEMIFIMLRVKDHRMISEDRLKKFWREIDWDGSNYVDFVEFVAWYLKYFGADDTDADVAPSIAEAFYDSFNPSIQRRQVLDSLS